MFLQSTAGQERISWSASSIFRLISLLGLLCGCQDSSSPSSSATQPPPAAIVQTVQPKRGPITRFVTLPAEIKAYQQATLYAKVAGYLKTINVDKGDRVKEGDLIADIEVPEMLADIQRYKAEMEVANLDFQRLSESQKKLPDLVVPQTVDNARGRLEIAKANLERTETLLNYAKITAPFSGIITRRNVDPGAFIPAATSGGAPQSAAIVTLADLNRVRVQVAGTGQGEGLVVAAHRVTHAADEAAGRGIEGK